MTSIDTLLSLAKSLRDSSVLVIGDIMLDRFVYGSVDRISPESPVPVLAIKREEQMLGGAGNAVANLAGLGVRGSILSVVGDDKDGKQIRAMLGEAGFKEDGLVAATDRPTIVKTRFLAGHQQLLRSDFEKKQPLSPTLENTILHKAEDIIKDMDAVILSDYGKGVLTAGIIAGVIELAHKHDIPVVADPKGHDFSIYKGVDAITPNKKELSEATRGMPVGTDDEVIAASRVLIEECGVRSVVATRSGDGLSVVESAGDPVHIRSADIEVFDVSGAGDTVIATLAAALASGSSLADAAALANIAGGIVVTKVGTAPIRTDDLLSGLRDAKGGRAERSVQTEGEALETVQRWRAKGMTIGFTNGCFDILHYGHVSYLQEARRQCDRLIVGLNKDTSIKILKGDTRPVHDEQSRLAVLGALACVDLVVLFGAEKKGEDNTASALLNRLQPDLYFKGGDYTPDQIPEKPTVDAYGGSVRVLPVYEGHSTTNSIRKIQGESAA